MSDLPRWATVTAKAGLVLAVVLFAAVSGYCEIFSRFQPYDDEGLILINARQVADGHALYDEVHALYGPFFFLLTTALYHVGLLPLTHDAVRLLTLVWWLGSSGLAAVIVGRATGSVFLSAVAVALAFGYQGALANEPGHPQGLLNLLVLALPALALLQSERCTALGQGAVAACLLFTKINIGVFVACALAHSRSAGVPGPLARGARLLLGGGMLLLPAVLMRRDLEQTWVWGYALTAMLAILPVVAWPHEKEESVGPRWRDLLFALLGFGAVAIILATAVFGQGTKLGGLWHGMVGQHLALPFTLPFRGEWSGAAAVAGPASAVLYLRARARHVAIAEILLTVLRALFALVVLANGFWGEPPVILSLALPFAWLGLATGDVEPSIRAVRRLLATLAVMQALLAYPVAGTQMVGASLLLLPIALIAAADVAQALAKIDVALLQNAAYRRLAFGCLAALLLLAQGQRARLDALRYESLLPLELPGATQVRLPEEYVMIYRWLSTNLQAHADAFYTQPGMNSLYFWTGIEAPTRFSTTTWMTIFPPELQQAIVQRLRESPRVCAVVSAPWTEFWLNGQPLPDGPLVRYLRDEFQTCGRVEGFELRTLKERGAPALIGCVRVLTRPPTGGNDAWTAEATLPPSPRSVGRLAVYELPAGVLVAATDAPDGMRLDSETTGAVRQLRFTPGRPIGPKAVLALRVYDAKGDWLTTLPFLD